MDQYNSSDIAFIAMAGALVFLMIPGFAFLYSGLSRRKNALSLIWVVCACNSVVVFQWYIFGYSIASSQSATNGFAGNLNNFGLIKVAGNPSPRSPLIPEILYSFLQMEFACVTAGILIGASAERGRVVPAMIFVFLWITAVYCPIAYWAWGKNGWASKWGVLDFAGGGPVEIASGIGGLTYAWILGRREEVDNYRPYNVSLVGLGTFTLWFGWLGFNGGSAFGANLRAIFAIWNTIIAAAIASIVWSLLDFRTRRRWSMVSLCFGTIAGLAGATPCAGYIYPWASVIVGIVSGAACNFATKVKFLLNVDDPLEVFALHGVGGIVGLFLNAFLASNTITSLDGVTVVSGGWINRNWKQLYIQLIYICVSCVYSFVMTVIVVRAVEAFREMDLRITTEAEKQGVDETEMGEFATDYIELSRDFGSDTLGLKSVDVVDVVMRRASKYESAPEPHEWSKEAHETHIVQISPEYLTEESIE